MAIPSLNGDMDAEAITVLLGGKWRGRYGSCRCPAHDDSKPSLSVSNADDGKILVHCHTGCDQMTVVEKLKAMQLWPEAERIEWMLRPASAAVNGASKASAPQRILAVYDYVDENGELLYQVIRKEGKSFPGRRPTGANSWAYNLDGVRRILYRLPEIIKAVPSRTVFIVEGEKDVDRLRGLELLATCNPHGAGKWLESFNSVLAGRAVAIIPDNDKPGIDHANLVAAHLFGIAASVKIIELPGVAKKGDVSDWLDSGNDVEALKELVKSTPALVAPPSTEQVEEVPEEPYPTQTLAELVSSRFHTEVAYLINGLLRRGKTHWVYAAPGVGKTLIMVALGMHIAAGKPFCGREVQQGNVLFIGEDSPLDGIAEYADLIADAHGIDLEGLPFFINCERGLRLTSPAVLEVLKAVALQRMPTLVVIDSAERVVPSEKFNSAEIDQLVKFVAWLTDQGITVVVIDHTNKKISATKKEDAKSIDMLDLLYGGRTKSAMADVGIYLSGTFKGGMPVRATWTKERGEPTDPLDFRFDSADGFRVTEGPKRAKTDNEQKVLYWFNNGHTSGYFSRAEIAAGSGIRERSSERVLRIMANSNMLASRQENAPHGGTMLTYALNSAAVGGSFDDA